MKLSYHFIKLIKRKWLIRDLSRTEKASDDGSWNTVIGGKSRRFRAKAPWVSGKRFQRVKGGSEEVRLLETRLKKLREVFRWSSWNQESGCHGCSSKALEKWEQRLKRLNPSKVFDLLLNSRSVYSLGFFRKLIITRTLAIRPKCFSSLMGCQGCGLKILPSFHQNPITSQALDNFLGDLRHRTPNQNETIPPQKLQRKLTTHSSSKIN